MTNINDTSDFLTRGNDKRNNTELLPCPFCGGIAELERVGNDFHKKQTAQIVCQTFGCFCTQKVGLITGHATYEWAENKVIELWNTRADKAALTQPVAVYHDTDYTSPLRPKRLEYTMCGKIYAVQENGERHMFMDVRGWGYLTGGGAKNLPYEEAAAIQDKWANEVVNLWNNTTRPDVNAELTILRKVLDFLPDKKAVANALDFEMEHAEFHRHDDELVQVCVQRIHDLHDYVEQAIAHAEKGGE